MGRIDTVYTLQHGSSGTYKVTNELKWYIIREAWEGTRMLNQRLVEMCDFEDEAHAALFRWRNRVRRVSCAAADLVEGLYDDLIGKTHAIRLVGGHKLYETASLSRGGNIRLEAPGKGRRYIPPDRRVELVPFFMGP